MLKKLISLLLAFTLLLIPLAGSCDFLPVPGTLSGAALNLAGENPLTLDPARSMEMSSHGYILQIFSGLVTLDDDMNPVPDIAASWSVSEDGLTYTFKLRPGVKFHSGAALTARDFKYAWERACSPATGSRTAATYLGDIVGASEMLDGKAKALIGVTVLDDATLEVKTGAPKSYFLWKLSYPTAFAVQPANVQAGGEWWRQPNGTGPFRLKQWDVNKLIVLERNQNYYRDLPKLNSVVFQLYTGNPIDLYEQGKVDEAGVGTEYIDKVTDKAGPFYRDLNITPELSFAYIGFNCRKPPFDDPDIRRAFNLAIDKDKIIAITYRDMLQKAYGILPAGIPGYNEKVKGAEYDVALAKALIARSKYGGGNAFPPVTLTTSGLGGYVSGFLEAVVSQWRENLGVEVQIRQLEPELFQYGLDRELDNLFDMGWVADYPHPQNFLEVLFMTGASYNYGGYSNPAADGLLEQAGVTRDLATSLSLYRQAEQLMVDDTACIPLWFGRNYYLVQSSVNGYRVSPLGTARLSSVSKMGS
jgi:oligopeptide transport system substrate-binding protein